MSINFEEIDFKPTSLGALILRRRRMPRFGDLDIYEVKLGDDFLMTSLFHEAEDQLAHLGLAALAGDGFKGDLDIVVGGLGLGYTAVESLRDPRVRSLVVVDFLQEVIDWHQKELVPMGRILKDDVRCHLVQGDFFALAKIQSQGFDPRTPQKKHHAILLDIDHTPDQVLSPSNVELYTEKGLSELATHLLPQGVFALWTDGVALEEFRLRLEKVFGSAQAHTITFDNPLHDGASTGAVYVARLL